MSRTIKVGTRVETPQGVGVVISTGTLGAYGKRAVARRVATVSLEDGSILHHTPIAGMTIRNPRPYHTLVEWTDKGFAPQFGDYSRAVVAEERAELLRWAETEHDNVNADYYTPAELRCRFRIVRTATDDQPAIDAAVAALNTRTAREGLYGQRKGGAS